MEKGLLPWLIDALHRRAVGRIVAALLGALIGVLLDAGLLDGQLGEHLLRVLSGS